MAKHKLNSTEAREIRAKQEREGRSPALKHGAYSAALRGGKVDGRTRLGQAIRGLRARLTADIGGAPSVQQNILIDRIVQQVFQAQALEAAIAAGQREPEGFYLSLVNSLRLNLIAIGLERRCKDITDLNEYIKEKGREHN